MAGFLLTALLVLCPGLAPDEKTGIVGLDDGNELLGEILMMTSIVAQSSEGPNAAAFAELDRG